MSASWSSSHVGERGLHLVRGVRQEAFGEIDLARQPGHALGELQRTRLYARIHRPVPIPSLRHVNL